MESYLNIGLIILSPARNIDAANEVRCYICGRNGNEISGLLGVSSVEGYDFRTLYIKEGGGLMDSKVVDHKHVNLCDSERNAVHHMKIDVVVCPICKILVNSLSSR